MKRTSTKKYKSVMSQNSFQKIDLQQQLFQKVSRTLTATNINLTRNPNPNINQRPSEHNKIIMTINQQIKRPETSKRMKNDYKNLINLIDCNKKVIQSRQKSILSYKKMKNINKQASQNKYYQPLFQEIQNTQENLCKKKYKKYNVDKFKMYLQQKSSRQSQIDDFVQNTLFQGMRDIKTLIPPQAKLHQKLSIFGQLLLQQKKKHVEQIKTLIMRQKQKTPHMTKSCKIYLINHYLIEKLMMKIYSDSSAIELKKRNSEIYEQIKNQMISEIIKQKDFVQILDILYKKCEQDVQIKRKQQERRRVCTPARSLLRQKMNVKKHQRYGSQSNLNSNGTKQNQLVFQFQKLYEMANQKINEAQLQLSFPTKRKNNFYSVMQIKETQNKNKENICF